MQLATNVKPLFVKSLETKIEDFRTLDRELKRITKLHEALKKDITQEMEQNSLQEAVDSYGHVLATYTEQARDSFNKAKFEIDYPNVYDAYLQTTFYKTFRLK